MIHLLKPILAIFLFFTLPVYAADSLTGDQIKAVFSDKTSTWRHLKKDRAGKTWFAADGIVKTVMSDGTEREGKWSVESDKLCISFGGCKAIIDDGDGVYYKIKKNGKKTTYMLLENGNKL